MSTASPTTRSASEFEPVELLRIVRAVAELAAPAEPETVSTRVWDTARPDSAQFADAPAARRIAEHLGLPWPKVRELAFRDGNGQLIALGRALNDVQNGWLTAEHCDFVLTLVAGRLKVRTLTPGQYRAEAHAMLAADRRKQLRLPTVEQVAALAGSWDRALGHAGLAARSSRGGQRARVRPVPIVDIIDRCFEAHGAEPTVGEVEVFAHANGIPFPRRERGRPYSDYVREWKDGRRTLGLTVPDGPPPKANRPDYAVDVGAARPGERRGTSRWDDLDVVVGWVARYLSELPHGGRSSQHRYRDWAARNPGAPWPAAFEKFGGWTAVRDLAQQSLRG